MTPPPRTLEQRIDDEVKGMSNESFSSAFIGKKINIPARSVGLYLRYSPLVEKAGIGLWKRSDA